MLQRIHVDLELELRHLRRHQRGPGLQQLGSPGQHRLLAHPQQVDRKLIGDCCNAGIWGVRLFVCHARRYFDAFQMVEQQRAGLPGHRCAAPGDVVTQHRRGGNADDVGDADLGGEGGILVPDVLELRLVPASASILLMTAMMSRIPSSATI